MDERLDQALAQVVSAHAGQRRKGTGLPYAVHPIDVAKLLGDIGASEPELLIAALLHDVVEDTPLELPELESRWGAAVARWVGELTKRDELPRDRYLASFASCSVEALLIKLADRHANVFDYLRGGFAERAAVYAREAEPIYDAAESRGPAIAERFGATVASNVAAMTTTLRAIADGEQPTHYGREISS